MEAAYPFVIPHQALLIPLSICATGTKTLFLKYLSTIRRTSLSLSVDDLMGTAGTRSRPTRAGAIASSSLRADIHRGQYHPRKSKICCYDTHATTRWND